MSVDERALKVIQEWNKREYKNEWQKAASLQVLIISALVNQDKITRHACADAFIDSGNIDPIGAIINARVDFDEQGE